MVAFKSVFFLTISVTTAWLPRDVNPVLAGLHKINADTIYLGNADKNFNGSTASATPIVAGVLALQTDLNATTIAAELALPFDEVSAESIVDYVASSLEPNTANTLNTLKANRDKIKQAGFYSTVQQQLVGLKTAVDKLSTAIENKTPSDKTSVTTATLENYQKDWVDAVEFFA